MKSQAKTIKLLIMSLVLIFSVSLTSCSNNKASQGNANQKANAPTASQAEGKCGDKKKCGEGKCGDKKKCGEGKCGDKKKCGEGKCGDKKKCGEGKCGDKKKCG